jgi:hypothetical protein
VSFRYELQSASVIIDGVPCFLINISDREIQCETGPHIGSVITKVEVQRAGNGIAKEVNLL